MNETMTNQTELAQSSGLESATRVNLQLGELVQEAQAKKIESEQNAVVATGSVVQAAEMSALEKMKLEKEKSQQGLVMTQEEYEAGLNKELRSATDTVEREEDVRKFVAQMDETIKKRTDIVVIKQPQNEYEYSQMVEEINCLTTKEDGTKVFIRKDDEANFDGKTYTEVQEEFTPVFVRVRTEEDGEYSKENDKKLLAQSDPNANVASDPVEEGTESDSAIDEEKHQLVEILIDKTGMGNNIEFSEEEKQKIVESDLIKIKKVRTMSLSTMKIVKKEQSFQEKVNEQRISAGGVRMHFPGSGFSATMTGLTYAELSDLAIDVDNDQYIPNVDDYYKRFTVIYNHMTNVSIGKFESFEEFLRHFAYVDVPLAIYGLVVATFPEINTIGLQCGKDGCKKHFEWQYQTRGLIHYDKCSDAVIEGINKLVDLPAIERDAVRDAADVNNAELIELPYTKKVINLTFASCYEFLYNVVPVLDPDNYKNAFSDSFSHAMMIDALFSITAVYTPVEESEGSYEEHIGYKEILDELVSVHPLEAQLINTYASKNVEKYYVNFAIDNVVCPHCKSETKSIPISIDSLVFRIYQTVATTEIAL